MYEYIGVKQENEMKINKGLNEMKGLIKIVHTFAIWIFSKRDGIGFFGA